MIEILVCMNVRYSIEFSNINYFCTLDQKWIQSLGGNKIQHDSNRRGSMFEETDNTAQEKSKKMLYIEFIKFKVFHSSIIAPKHKTYHLLLFLAWCYESNVSYEGKILKTVANLDFDRCVEECENKELGCQGFTFYLYSNLTIKQNTTKKSRQYYYNCKLMLKIKDTVGRDRKSWVYDNLVSGRKDSSCISNEEDLDAGMTTICRKYKIYKSFVINMLSSFY